MEYNSKIKLKPVCELYFKSKLEAYDLPKTLLNTNNIFDCCILEKFEQGPYDRIYFEHIDKISFSFLNSEYEIIEDKLPVKEENNTIITIEKIEQILNDNFDRDDIQDIIKCLKDNLFKEVVEDASWVKQQLEKLKNEHMLSNLGYFRKSYSITGSSSNLSNHYYNNIGSVLLDPDIEHD
jgi:hydroxymethylpyrimidine pyrophosphatase-like HAD family hydrolase